MSEEKYNVVEVMIQKGRRFYDKLTDGEIALLSKQDVSGIGSPGIRAVAEVLEGQFPDDAVMQRLVLETAARGGAFDEIVRDVRLHADEASVDTPTLKQAKEVYNRAMATRFGIEIAGDGALEILGARKQGWVSHLPDYQVEEVAKREGVPVYPSDVVRLVEPYFDRPDLLGELVKQSVEEMKPIGAFFAELREWAKLSHIEPAMAARVRRCYHALMASGLEVDMAGEIDRRNHARAEHVTDAVIVETLAPHYSRPDRIAEILGECIEEGKSLADFLAALRAEGELAHLRSGAVGQIRREFNALSIRAQQQQPRQRDTRQALGDWSERAAAQKHGSQQAGRHEGRVER